MGRGRGGWGYRMQRKQQGRNGIGRFVHFLPISFAERWLSFTWALRPAGCHVWVGSQGDRSWLGGSEVERGG